MPASWRSAPGERRTASLIVHAPPLTPPESRGFRNQVTCLATFTRPRRPSGRPSLWECRVLRRVLPVAGAAALVLVPSSAWAAPAPGPVDHYSSAGYYATADVQLPDGRHLTASL